MGVGATDHDMITVDIAGIFDGLPGLRHHGGAHADQVQGDQGDLDFLQSEDQGLGTEIIVPAGGGAPA